MPKYAEYVELSNEDLYNMIPIFAGFIEVGRMGYRLDMTEEELAKEIVNFKINRQRMKDFAIIEGGK